MIAQAFETTQDKIIAICDSIKELLIEKNRRYGDSALCPSRRFSKLDNKQGILIRLDDKMNRIENSDEPRINDMADLIGYEILYLIAIGVRKEDILALID